MPQFVSEGNHLLTRRQASVKLNANIAESAGAGHEGELTGARRVEVVSTLDVDHHVRVVEAAHELTDCRGPLYRLGDDDGDLAIRRADVLKHTDPIRGQVRAAQRRRDDDDTSDSLDKRLTDRVHGEDPENLTVTTGDDRFSTLRQQAGKPAAPLTRPPKT